MKSEKHILLQYLVHLTLISETIDEVKEKSEYKQKIKFHTNKLLEEIDKQLVVPHDHFANNPDIEKIKQGFEDCLDSLIKALVNQKGFEDLMELIRQYLEGNIKFVNESKV